MGYKFESLPGSTIYKKLKDAKSIILAANTRITNGIVDGIFEAAKKFNTVVIFELAKSECNLSGGYTGQTPATYSKAIHEAAERNDWPYFIVHGDHLTIKNPEKDVPVVKDLIKAQINAGYTSFAIDASFLFNVNGLTEKEQLQQNIEVTTELAYFIKDNMSGKEFGLEVEVGEIGKRDDSGLVITTVEEATTYINELKKKDIHPNFLAIANGSTHGNIFDDSGKLVEQLSIDIPRTIEIARSLAENGVKIAQHGITGTPIELIAKHFPKGLIGKGNVGTYWQNIAWDVLKVFEPDLFDKIKEWTISRGYDEGDTRPEGIIFGKNSKYAIKQFFDEIYDVDARTREALKAIAYSEALKFFKAFNSIDTVKFIK
ncbi:MAG: class II fructose-bisphosphate aldolase [Candidatus Helarchaeota archaeon]